ncbi:hypothetical protein ACQ4LE_004371 [Meloidogyne hapla]|uniref:Probable pectate lyase F n=1 Tax=Meloidogyne hapla TaxID=6305 RepID=A0A1I8BM97_MELHA
MLHLILSFFCLFMPSIALALNTKGATFCKFPTPSKTITTSKTYFINNHTDFKMQRIIFNGQKGTCNPKIPKQWDSVIVIQDGGSVSNLILGESPDGTAADINCMGSCTLTNVWWEKVCWRAASFRSTTEYNRKLTNHIQDSTQFTYIVDGGGALDGFQKVFDQSGPGKTIVKNFCAANCSIGLRSCGDCGKQFQRDMTITDSKFMGPGLVIVGANQQYKDKITLRNIQVYGYNNPATKTAFACVETVPNAKNPWAFAYIPGMAGTSVSCKYPASAVKVIN